MPRLIVLTALLGFGVAIPQTTLAQKAPLADFDAYVAKAVADWRVPGLAIAVVKNDSVVFLKGYGVRELGKPDPVTVHTRFGVMSTTKAFTALLLAMLADSAKVAWEDPVTKYLPDLQFQDPYVTREVRLRDIVTHRIGFPDPDYLWAGVNFTFAEMARRLRWIPAATSLRSRFAYNNVAYALAGEVAARAGGKSWQDLMRSRIYAPLGMSESYPDARSMREAGVTDVSAPHGIVRDTVQVLPVPPGVVDPVAPAGAMFSTASDMARWLRFLLDSARVGGKRLLSARGFAELFTPQQVVPDEEFYPTARLTHPHFQAYGMGWFLEDYRGEFVAFHTGSIEGRSAIVGLIPERRLGVVIFTNLDHSELRHALMYSVFDRYIGGAAGRDWSTEMRMMYQALRDTAETRRKEREGRRIAGTHPTLPLERYAAEYADSLFGRVVIKSEGGRLLLKLGELEGVLEHWQYDVFRVNWSDAFQGSDYIAFSLDPDGSVGELRVVGGPLRYRRVRPAAP